MTTGETTAKNKPRETAGKGGWARGKERSLGLRALPALPDNRTLPDELLLESDFCVPEPLTPVISCCFLAGWVLLDRGLVCGSVGRPGVV